MRRPHLSTGGWIFASVVTVSLIGAPAAVYAASTSTVSIGNPTGTTTANVDPERQLLTNAATPSTVVHGSVLDETSACVALYSPPAGKAVVVTSITYAIGDGGGSQGPLVELSDESCTAAPYDVAATVSGKDTFQHLFPAGLPMPSLGIDGGDDTTVTFTGYLIPAGQLPTAPADSHARTATRLKIREAAH